MLNIVLVEPEIPQNTGNVARTCACIGARLHLVEPMGFAITQRNLARAGCDYWDDVDIVRWSCADEFFEAHAADDLHLFTACAAQLRRRFVRPGCLAGVRARKPRARRGRYAALRVRLRAHPYARWHAQLKLKQFSCNSRLRGFAPAKLARFGLNGAF